MITYSEAVAKVARSRSGEAKLCHNTYVRELWPHGSNADYAVKFHATDVITIHPDHTFTLNTGGWNTTTTLRRLNDWSPARVYSHKGQLYIWHTTDPKTPAKVQKCRTCHGTGTLHTHAWTERYGWLTETWHEQVEDHYFNSTDSEGNVYGYIYAKAGTELVRDGKPLRDQPRMITTTVIKTHRAGTHDQHKVPIFHPSEPYTCTRCSGTGRADYGNRPNPVMFFDGITVDGSGMVTDPAARRMYESSEDKAARLAAEARAAKAAARKRARELKASNIDRVNRWLDRASHDARLAEQAGDAWPMAPEIKAGKMIVYKAVNADLRSGYHGPAGLPMVYAIGSTVTAPDWDGGEPRCGGGLHFSATPEGASVYCDAHAPRYLACEVAVKGLTVINGNKVKAKSAKVLHEVDIHGNRI